MGIFSNIGKVTQKTLYFKEDTNIQNQILTLDDRFVKRKEGPREQAWPFIPSLTLPLTFNGKYKGEYYLVSSRTGEPLDPLGLLDSGWKGKSLWTKITALATEEHHKIVSKVAQTRMDKALIPLAWGAGAFTLMVGLVALMS